MTFSRGQAVIATSSAEAELYGIIGAASEAIGLKSTFKDMNVMVDIVLEVDASAAIVMATRRGLGKTKHISTAYLWIQEWTNDGRIQIVKRATDEMLADFLTKPTSETTIRRCLSGLGFECLDGRHKLALKT